MVLEERLEKLKKELTPDDLVIRYTDYKNVMSKIESTFLTTNNLNYKFSGWIEQLKGFEEIELEESAFEFLKKRLSGNDKFWWIYVDSPSLSNSRHRIFNATMKDGERLSFLFPGSPIFMVHKEYQWMLMIDRKNKKVKVKANLQ